MNSNVKEQNGTMVNQGCTTLSEVVPPNASHVADVAPSNAGDVVMKPL